MVAPTKSKRPKARDENRMAVEGGNREAKRRAEEAAMDEKAKKPVTKKAPGGSMKGSKYGKDTTHLTRGSKRGPMKGSGYGKDSTKSKKPVTKKMAGGKMTKKPTMKMAKGSSCRGMGAAKKGGKYSRTG